MTDYMYRNTIRIQSVGNNAYLAKTSTHFYFVTADQLITDIPAYMAKSLMGICEETFRYGPFIFYNNFEKSEEGKYLIHILPYFYNLKNKVRNKVWTILETSFYWVRPNKSVYDATLKAIELTSSKVKTEILKEIKSTKKMDRPTRKLINRKGGLNE